MTSTRTAIWLLKDHRDRLNFDREQAAELCGNTDTRWVYDVLKLHIQMVDHILDTLMTDQESSETR